MPTPNSSPTWTTLPQSAKADAALRRVAGEIAGWEDPPIECDPFLHDWNRDDLARVFQVGLLHAADQRKRGKFWTIYEMTLTSPRAALCALLDLLAVPVPQELL